MAVLLVDNYDSFTHNLAQLVAVITGQAPRVVRNDELSIDEAIALRPEAVILSPGPGSPEHASDVGIAPSLVTRLPRTPLLGVCLGHQVLGVTLGARIVHAPEPMHGRVSPVTHEGRGLFAGLPSPLSVVRYHSLILDGSSLPPSLRVIAETSAEGTIGQPPVMAIEHVDHPHYGVQFHPESILSEGGYELVANFLRLAGLPVRPRASSHHAPSRSPRSDAPRPRSSTSKHHEASRLVTRSIPFIEPERAFVGLWRDEPAAWWLDGTGRFSYLGPGNSELVRVTGRHIERRTQDGTERHDADPFTFLGELLLQRSMEPMSSAPTPGMLGAGYVGYLGYELKEHAGADSGPRRADALPDAQLMLADRVLVVDRERGAARLTALIDEHRSEARAIAWLDDTEARLREAPELSAPTPPGAPDSRRAPRSAFVLDRGADRYRADVARIQELLREGETYEICLTTQLRTRAHADPLDVYRMLRCTNPAPFSAFFRFPDCAILSASPELFVQIDEHGAVESRPIKGTRRRGRDAAEDHEIAAALATSTKDRAENLMIVDLVRHDLGGVCLPGSVHVPSLMAVEAHPTVFQMVSTVRGQLAPSVSPVEAVRALFPGGSMTGAPKLRSMRIIGELEGAPRGVYSGGLGYFSFDGSVRLAMAIRTIVQCNNELSFGVGGAVVALSDAEDELGEALLKGRALMRAIRAAQGEAFSDEEKVE